MKYLYVLHLLAELLLIVILLRAHKNVDKIFQKFYKFYKNLLSITGFKFVKKKYIKYTTAVLGLSVVSWNVAILYFSFSKTLPDYLCLAISTTISIYINQFPLMLNVTFSFVMTFAIRYRLQTINDLVSDYLKNMEDTPENSPAKFINGIKFLYLDLIDCKNAFNGSYGNYHWPFI